MKAWSNSDIPGTNGFVPEKKLLVAVLQRAITDYVTADGDIKENARIWLMEDETLDVPLTFSFICEALDLDRNSLRRAIELQAEAVRQGAVLEEIAV